MTTARKLAEENSKKYYGYDDNTRKYGEECFADGFAACVEEARYKSMPGVDADKEFPELSDERFVRMSDLEALLKDCE